MRQSNTIVATPEEFLYMKSVFIIKNAELVETESLGWFYGKIFDIPVQTDMFSKGKYTL